LQNLEKIGPDEIKRKKEIRIKKMKKLFGLSTHPRVMQQTFTLSGQTHSLRFWEHIQGNSSPNNTLKKG
jgi:hypothetical protein